MSSSLLLHQCPACLVRLTLIVFVMRCRWPYSWCFVGCCLQGLFKIAPSILVLLPSSFFSIRLVSVHVVHPYGNIDTIAAWKKLRFILSVRSDFPPIDLYEIPHIFYTRIIHSHCLRVLTGYIYTYIYIYIYIYIYVCVCVCVKEEIDYFAKNILLNYCVSQKFCNILVGANLWCVYHETETV